MTSKAVNVPTNQKVKEADVNAKLQLYGIYSGTSMSVKLPAVRNASSAGTLHSDMREQD